jgi:rubrerythrin
MVLEELFPLIKKKAIFEIENDLLKLFEMEVYSTKVYFEQIRKLDGNIVETLKILLAQEEKHADFLKKILEKINIKAKYDEIAIHVDNQLKKSVDFDINLENEATKKYEETIQKSSSQEMKKFLQHILEEEFNHIERLKRFVNEK